MIDAFVHLAPISTGGVGFNALLLVNRVGVHSFPSGGGVEDIWMDKKR